MDLGSREGHLILPIPFSAHYPSISDAARLQIFCSGNGISTEDGCVPEIKLKEPVRYRECQKNHAANIGGHALDGCGEFMPSGQEGTADSLKCAACGCHRNFHRREVEGERSCDCNHFHRDRKRTASSGPLSPAPLALPGPRDILASNAQTTMALNSTATDSDDTDAPHGHLGQSMKKRFRTKFSAEQKEKMCAFAETLGWRIQKHDEAAVQNFCAEIGVKRNVLKVWMHNNKHAVGNKMDNGSDYFKRSDSTSDLS